MALKFLNDGYFAGKVGIGTESPIELLHLYGGVGNPTRIRLQADDGQDDVLTFHQSTTQKGAVGYDDSDDVVSLTYGGLSGTTGIKINSSGNVGIGNTNPQYPLHFGDVSGYYISIGSGNSTPGGNTPWLGVFNNNSIASATYGWGIYDSSADGSFQIWNRAGNTTGYNTFTIKRGGNVGIGTTSPGAKLHVAGTGLFTGLVSGITPVNAANFVTKAYVDGSSGGTGPFLPLAGGTLSGNLTMDDSDILFEHSDGSNYYRLGIGASANFEIYNTNYGRTDLLITQSTGNATFAGNLNVNGNATLGDATTDDHVFNGQVTQVTGDALGYKLLRSNGATSMLISATSDAEIEFGTDNGSGTNTTQWTIGKDGTDNSFRISNSASLGTSDTLTLTGANATFAGDIIGGGSITIGSGGAYNAGAIYSDANWGMIFRALQASPNNSDFLFANSADVERLRITSTTADFSVTVDAPTFVGDLNGTINTATTGVTQANAINDTTIATTAYVNNKIALIPAGLVFQGTWNAATNTPTLTSGSGTTGNFYIVSVAGSTNLDGITDWKVGDWAVFIEQGASDQWEKIDNSSVLDGIGTGGSVAGWAGSGTSNTLTNSPITFSGNNTSFPDDATFDTNIILEGNIYHKNDTNTYFGFNPGASEDDTIIFNTAGSERMRINSSGDVGIGTTPETAGPTWRTLFVGASATIVSRQSAAGSDSIFANNYYVNSSNQDRVRVNAPSSRMFLDGNNIRFQISPTNSTAPSWSEIMRIDDSGNVGIGNTSPGAKLVVGANVNTAATGIEVNAGTGGANVLNAGSADNWFPYSDANNYYSASEHIFRSEVNSATRMTIKSDGRVGIGIILPTEKLEVVGNIKITSALLSNQENTDVDTGTETVANVAIATYTAAFFDFVIKKTTNVRSGTVYACHDGTNVEFTETSTQDLGDTSDVTLSVDISGGNMRLRATTTSDDWSVKSLIRAI